MPRFLAPTLAPAIALALTLAGCIAPLEQPPEDETRASAAPPGERIDGMTAEETKTDKMVPCSGENGTLPLPVACAERDLLVEGRIGVDELPVKLWSTNGAITLIATDDDSWSLHAVYRVQALTEEDAKKGLDTAWAWTHEDGDGHALVAGPRGDIGEVGLPMPLVTTQVVASKYEVELPSWVVLDLVASTSNGAITALGLQASAVDASTSNGAIELHVAAASVTASTSNGAIDLILQPTESGDVMLSSSNGAITLLVPEGRAHGYAVDASTSNGKIKILLEDGALEDGKDHATFKTDGFDGRQVQTTVNVQTSNGAITVAGE